MMRWDNKFCLLLMLVVFGAYLQAADSGSVDWQAFYKSLPVPAKNTTDGDDDSSWGSAGSSVDEEDEDDSTFDRADFDIIVKNLIQYKKFMDNLPADEDPLNKDPSFLLKKRTNRTLKQSIDHKIAALKLTYPLIKSFVQAAAADPDYNKIVKSIDSEVEPMTSEEFEAQKESIIQGYAACATSEETENYLNEYRHGQSGLSSDQKKEIEDSIISARYLRSHEDKIATVYNEEGEDGLDQYKDSKGRILSHLQKERIKNKYLTAVEFENHKIDLLEKYLRASKPVNKNLIINGAVHSGKYLSSAQKEVIIHLSANVSQDDLEQMLVHNFDQNGTHINLDQVKDFIKKLHLSAQNYDLDALVSFVNHAIDRVSLLKAQRAEAMQKVVDHFSSIAFSSLKQEQLRTFLDAQGLLAIVGNFDDFYSKAKKAVKERSDYLKEEKKRQENASPYILPEKFNRIKIDIIEIYKNFKKYPGVRAIILHGNALGKKLSKEQKKEIEQSVSLDGVVQVTEVKNVDKSDELETEFKQLRVICDEWKYVNFNMWKRRFTMDDDLEVSDIPKVYKMLNNEGITKHLSKKKHSHELTAEEFEQKKAEIFAVYKKYKNDSLLVVHLRGVIGSKKLTTSQIAELDAMMEGDQEDASHDEGAGSAGGTTGDDSSNNSSADHADEHVVGQVHELMQLNQTLIMIQV